MAEVVDWETGEIVEEEAEEGNLRVWWTRNQPPHQYYEVITPLAGRHLLMNLTVLDLRDSEVYSNAGGLEVYRDGEWIEWCDNEGYNIDEAYL